jgi:antitoxin FitA
MSAITVKNIPPEIYEKLKQSAQANHRSINSEIIACIERSVSSQRIQPEQLLASARKMRALTASHPATEDDITVKKHTGRL